MKSNKKKIKYNKTKKQYGGVKTILKNGDIYEGDSLDKNRTGYGIYKTTQGEFFEGNLVKGVKTGKGKYFYPTGDYYEGNFLNDKMTGKGTMVYMDGTIYEGDFKNGNKVGQGKLTFSNGNIYEGSFEHKFNSYLPSLSNEIPLSVMQGKGKMTFINGYTYEGDFVNNYFMGKGKMTFPTGNIYEGEFVNNDVNGKGKLIFVNGTVYEGTFKDNKITGLGKLTYPDGRIFEGTFENNLNLQDDIGLSTGKVNSAHGISKHKLYEQEKTIGFVLQTGKVTYPNGNVYEGRFVNDNEIYGTMTRPNGDKYEGYFVNGKIEGDGIFTPKSKKECVYKGEFVNGQKDGKGALTCPHGNNYEGEWEKDERIDKVSSERPSLDKSHSLYMTDQGVEGTCYAHAVTRIILNYMRRIYEDDENSPLIIRKKDYCSDLYITGVTKVFDSETNQIKVIDRNIEKLLYNIPKGKCSLTSKNNFLMFLYIYTLIINKFGCIGFYPYPVLQWFVNNIDKIILDDSNLEMFKNTYRFFDDINYSDIISLLNDFLDKTRSSPYKGMNVSIFEFKKYKNPEDALNRATTILKYYLTQGYYFVLSTQKHAVTVVNYKIKDNEFYLIIKNSWGNWKVINKFFDAFHVKGIITVKLKDILKELVDMYALVPIYEETPKVNAGGKKYKREKV